MHKNDFLKLFISVINKKLFFLKQTCNKIVQIAVICPKIKDSIPNFTCRVSLKQTGTSIMLSKYPIQHPVETVLITHGQI